ncbi:uncharacterized protein B0H18DRAFT_217325 [Fomitopsis serialis]|uniref:uncharacterized protein n=1 Tax=Fomitopsis serialis TaxID=139415 RepID=UPI002008B858|nr:uncharacterized protein B0H18DRAFT_217325 [Neoantrodia serialis]KAH9913053.1 hypothetical protein B0H18DRAFT_217325 [Neoantrodia serialis]
MPLVLLCMLVSPRRGYLSPGPRKGLHRTRLGDVALPGDFGLSRRYDSEAGPRLELPILGGDRSAPEHQGTSGYVPCDPMPTDVTRCITSVT